VITARYPVLPHKPHRGVGMCGVALLMHTITMNSSHKLDASPIKSSRFLEAIFNHMLGTSKIASPYTSFCSSA